MSVSKLTLTNFRSHRERDFEFDSTTTLIVGPNGSGKTNILEALHVLATTKSFRARDEALVAHNASYYRIMANINNTTLQLAYQSEPTKTKQASLGKTKRSLRDHIGSLPVVLFEPGDLNLLTGPPKARRAYIDTILCQTNKTYFIALAEYRRALSQRNALLDAKNYPDLAVLFAWNVRLAGPAYVMHAERKRFLDYLSTEVARTYQLIAGRKHSIEVRYEPSPSNLLEYTEASILDWLEQNANRDVAAGFTTGGPHRDDFTVIFDNKPISQVASRGEHRSVVLALKLAELGYQAQHANTPPLFMLDDVFSELDANRRAFLLQSIGDFQTIVTTTEADSLADHNYYTITLEAPHE